MNYDEKTMSHSDHCTSTLASAPFVAKRLLLLVARYLNFFREKRALKKLDDRLLKDISIDHADRDAALKQFWGAPDHWSR